MGKNFQTHHFFCIKCGKEGIPLPRRQGHKHKRFHRKKLYCPYCKMEINHVECRTHEDIVSFKEDFEKGAFTDEAKENLAYFGVAGVR